MSIIKHVTLQKIVAHDFRYDPRTSRKHEADKSPPYGADVKNTQIYTSTLSHIFIACVEDRFTFLPLLQSTYIITITIFCGMTPGSLER